MLPEKQSTATLLQYLQAYVSIFSRILYNILSSNTPCSIEMNVYKQYLFKPQSIKLYSEQDFIVKFWSYVFEEVFSNSGLYLHW